MSQIDVYTEPGPRPEGIELRIYSNPICPFAQRARLAAYAKGVSFEEINIHLKVKPDWFLEKITPVGKVPVIEHNGHIIRESLITFDYIDEVFGDKSLWPDTPFQKAQARLLVNDFGEKTIPSFYKIMRNPSDTEAIREFINFFEKLEDIIKARGTNAFISGVDKPGAPDYLIWPWIERSLFLKHTSDAFATAFTEEKFPLVHGYIAQMFQDEPVKKVAIPTEKLQEFARAFQSGKHDYSIADLTGKGVTIYTKKQD